MKFLLKKSCKLQRRLQVYCLTFLTFILIIVEAGTQENSLCVNKLVYDIAKNFDWASVTFIRSTSSDADNVPSPYGLSRLSSILRSQSIITGENWQKYKVYGNFFVSYYEEPLLLELQEKGLVKSTNFIAIFFRDEKEFGSLISFAKNASLFIDSQFYAFDITHCQMEVKVYGMYRVGERVDELIIENGGSWSSSSGFGNPNFHKTIIVRRSDFRGYPMVGVGVKVFPHFTTYLQNGGVSGFVGDLVTALQMAHNFTLEIQMLKGYAYGTLINLTTNQWNGMTGELQNKKVDLTVSELSITKERAEVITYTQPLYVISRRMYVGTTVDKVQKLLTYTTTMSVDLYAATFIMILILAMALSAISKLHEKLLPDTVENNAISFGIALWIMFSALLQQGLDTSPDAISLRMVFWYGFLLSVVVFTAYSATLVSHLAVVSKVQLPFSDLNGLVRSPGWDAGNVKNDLFQVTASQTCAGSHTKACMGLQTLWNKVIMRSEGNLVDTYLEGLKKALKHDYVFIGVDVTTRNFIKQLPPSEACSLRELEPKYITGGIAIGLQHRSPFLDTFDHSLQKMKEMGVMDKIVSKWLKGTQNCPPVDLVSADMYDVGSLFTILILGAAFGLMILLVECLNFKSKKNKLPFPSRIA